MTEKLNKLVKTLGEVAAQADGLTGSDVSRMTRPLKGLMCDALVNATQALTQATRRLTQPELTEHVIANEREGEEFRMKHSLRVKDGTGEEAPVTRRLPAWMYEDGAA